MYVTVNSKKTIYEPGDIVYTLYTTALPKAFHLYVDTKLQVGDELMVNKGSRLIVKEFEPDSGNGMMCCWYYGGTMIYLNPTLVVFKRHQFPITNKMFKEILS